MKYLLFIFLFGISLNALSQTTVLSFNIRYDNPGDGENQWSFRKDKVADLIQFHEATIVGMQEALKSQIDDLQDLLPGFSWIGVGRDDGKEAGEFSPVFYKKDQLTLLKKGTFWLSETCDIAGSRGWDAACNRVVTWVFLKIKQMAINSIFSTPTLITREK